MVRYTVTTNDEQTITVDADHVFTGPDDYTFANGQRTSRTDPEHETVAIFPRHTVRSIIRDDTPKPTVGKAYIDLVSLLDAESLERVAKQIEDRFNRISPAD